jgi:hypothetical protein
MCPCAGYDDAESELKKVPRVIPTNEKAYREYAEAKRWERARETIAGHRGVLPSQVTNDQIAKYLANQERFERHRLEREERERQGEKPIYGPGGEHSFFRDLVADAMARKSAREIADATFGDPRYEAIPGVLSPIANAGDLVDVRKRLATVGVADADVGVELGDVSSGDPGAVSFLGPGFLGDRFNTAARAEASLTAALGLEPLPQGVKEINIPRFETGASAAVQATEGSEVSEANVDGGTQASKIQPSPATWTSRFRLWSGPTRRPTSRLRPTSARRSARPSMRS